DVPHDGEPEAEAAVRAVRARVRLAEAVEDVGQELGADAPPAVAHLEAHAVAGALDAEDDLAAGVGELDRVREEVGEDLLETVRIADDAARTVLDRAREPQVLRIRAGPHRLDRAP